MDLRGERMSVKRAENGRRHGLKIAVGKTPFLLSSLQPGDEGTKRLLGRGVVDAGPIAGSCRVDSCRLEKTESSMQLAEKRGNDPSMFHELRSNRAFIRPRIQDLYPLHLLRRPERSDHQAFLGAEPVEKRCVADSEFLGDFGG